MKKLFIFLAFVLLGLAVNAQLPKYECQTDTVKALWLQPSEGIKFPNDLNSGIDYFYGDGGRMLTMFVNRLSGAGYTGLGRIYLGDSEDNPSTSAWALTSTDSAGGTGRYVEMGGSASWGNMYIHAWGLVEKNTITVDSTGLRSTKPIGIANFPIPNIYTNTLQLEPTDTTTAVLGTIVFKTSDATFYGCISTSAAKKWVAFH